MAAHQAPPSLGFSRQEHWSGVQFRTQQMSKYSDAFGGPGFPHREKEIRKNTGVGCHFLLQCMKVKSVSEVALSCPTLATPWTAAHQAPPSMGFSRQKYWSGVPLPSLKVRENLCYLLKTRNISMESLLLKIKYIHIYIYQFSSVQLLSRVQLFATPWTAAHQASLSITNSRSSLKLTSIESVMPSSHLILCDTHTHFPAEFAEKAEK